VTPSGFRSISLNRLTKAPAFSLASEKELFNARKRSLRHFLDFHLTDGYSVLF